MGFDTETVIAFVSAVGLSSIVAAAINALSNRKKTGADATKVITDAALGVVTELRTEIAGLKSEIAELKADAELRDRRDRAAHQNLARHHQWDLRLVSIVNRHLPDHVSQIPSPPPLFPDEGKDYT